MSRIAENVPEMGQIQEQEEVSWHMAAGHCFNLASILFIEMFRHYSHPNATCSLLYLFRVVREWK